MRSWRGCYFHNQKKQEIRERGWNVFIKKTVILLCVVLLSCSCESVLKQAEQTPEQSSTDLEQNGIEIQYISDLAYNHVSSVDPIVYIEESSGWKPYIVLTDQYKGNTLLLRKETIQEGRFSDYSAYYENSEIDVYLNSEYFMMLSDASRKQVEDTEIRILSSSCLEQLLDDTISITRKVFLLSFTELSYSQNGHVGIEGEPLKYFDENQNRCALTEDGIKTGWWLRSADSTYDSAVYAVGPEGEIGSTSAFSQNGIRPAFCVANDCRVQMKENKFYLEK